MPSTSDPVSLIEIAERTGHARETVSGWKKRGLLPDPDWICGRAGIWAWERLQLHPTVARHLSDVPRSAVWPELFGAIRRAQGPLRHSTVPEADYLVVKQRTDRHMHGWVSVPVGEARLFITSDEGDADVVSLVQAEALLTDALEAHRGSTGGSTRSAVPAVSPHWFLPIG